MVIRMMGKGKESAYKKIAAAGAAFFFLMCLTACGSNGMSDVTDKPDVPDTADAVKTAENIEESTPKTCEDYMLLAADSYEKKDWKNALSFYQTAKELDESREEVYRGISDVYLQMDDVKSALAILDEGIERLNAKETGMKLQDVDSLSQRKEYILACTAAVRKKLTEKYRDEEDMWDSRITEYDNNGNQVYYAYYNAVSGIDGVTERRYDDDGNQIEYQFQVYDSEGNHIAFTHETWAYDANGKEIEYVSYDENGEIEKKTQSEYDTNGNQIKEIQYGSGGEKTRWTEWKYNAAGCVIEYADYNLYGNCTRRICKEYDEQKNLLKTVTTGYDRKTGQRSFQDIYEYGYDENGNRIKCVLWNANEISVWNESEYDGNGIITQHTDYYSDGTVESVWEYDERGNEIKHTRYNGESAVNYMREYEYDESGRQTCSRSYDGGSIVTGITQYEYDERGNLLKAVTTDYDRESGQQNGQRIYEYGYDENGNMTKYDAVTDTEETYRCSWEREYNENGRETAFSYEDDATFYESKTEYDENGLPVRYTGMDENGDILVHKETEYDVSGKVIKESYYDADETLVRYYENEYDDFGSVTRQAMYEDGILKSEKQLSYTYHYIGDIDTQTMDNQNYDTDSDEYRQRQMEILDRFLKGEEKTRCCDGVIVSDAVTDLADFTYAKMNNDFPQYAYLDMTGDGIEELLIWNYYFGRFYIIQCEYGILKVIYSLDTSNWRGGIEPVIWNGRTALKCAYHGLSGDSVIYYFFDGRGKKEVCISYLNQESANWIDDNDSFEEREMSRGEYRDITDATITEIDIDWQKLEAPAYGND
ncbi:MAG: hypothetical protein NC231_14940 [Bacillus sp. (in: Bacteria)]|nr:hypothetical protein [Bacillus sp. (in: firmicutes)]MCM1427407.1 hypothetical protein [Eubacterium sp.]